MNRLTERIRRYIAMHRKDRRFRTAVTALAGMVVFVTTYMLIYPALALEKETYCGIPVHEHTQDCYSLELYCDLEETDGHTHDKDCYEEKDILVCEEKEHTHGVGRISFFFL